MSTKFVSATGFDFLLPWYDTLVQLATRERRFKNHLLDQAALKPGLRLLDVGCGTGTLLAAALRREPGLRAVGVDPDSRVLALAARKFETPVSLQVAAAQQLPFDDGSFEVAVSSLVFHHLQPHEKSRALAEIARVLVPSGQLLLADFAAPASVLARLAFTLTVRLIDGWQRTACNVAGRLPQLLTDAGFSAPVQSLVLATPLGTLRCYLAHKL